MIQSATSSPRLIAALAYAAAGIPIFPCKADRIHACVVDPKTGKCPICNALKAPATPNSFRDATTDQSIIRGWWAEADYNLAVCPEDAGWCVFDADGAAGIAEAKEAGLPDTYTVGTPGEGDHYYYDGSLPPSVKRFSPHIDTRGRGSYVLLPPSVVNGKHYWVKHNRPIVPVREADADRVKSQLVPMKAPEGVVLDAEWMVDLARDYLKRVYDREGPWGEEDDPDTYKIAAGVKDHGISEELTVDLMMEHLAEDERDWMEKTVDHVYRFGKHEIGARALPDPASWGVEDLPPPPADEPEAPPRLLRNRFSFKTPEEEERASTGDVGRGRYAAQDTRGLHGRGLG